MSVEDDLNIALPASLRRVLLTVSSHVEFRWFRPDGLKFPPPFRSNFSGQLHWSLDYLRSFNQAKDSWIETVFPNRADPYDVVWHDKLAFLEVANGDYLSIDLSPEKYEQVVYLSHDDGEGHGHVLAEDFGGLLRRWLPLACTGAEDWQWLPFTDGKSTMIDPACRNAILWRSLLGITI